jgi:putative nucleotidyltransferase with HDIG domain
MEGTTVEGQRQDVLYWRNENHFAECILERQILERMPTRDDAYQLMTDHVKNENLRKHMLSVEVAMRFYARKYGEDEELWAITGLLHDCDYEEYPDLREHTQVAAGWLREQGYDERIIYAILAHNDVNEATHPRNNLLSKALYACDEITGMITATATVTKCHSRRLASILPELISLFGSPA